MVGKLNRKIFSQFVMFCNCMSLILRVVVINFCRGVYLTFYFTSSSFAWLQVGEVNLIYHMGSSGKWKGFRYNQYLLCSA